MNVPFSRLLDASSYLSGVHSEPNSPNKDLLLVLKSRLLSSYDVLGRKPSTLELDERCGNDLETTKFLTASESLLLLESIESILNGREHALHEAGETETSRNGRDASDSEPTLGIRDMAQLRTLTSILFNWGTGILLSRLIHRIRPLKSGVEVIDLTDGSRAFSDLCSMITRIFAILLPDGIHGQVSQTFISTNLITRHVIDLLRPSIFLAWLPKAFQDEFGVPPSGLRQLVLQLLSILPPSQTITCLGGVISSKPAPPAFVQKTCAALLSRQLLRQNGVRGLLASMFGENEASEPEMDAPIERLEQVAKVLRTIPTGLTPEVYYDNVIPQILEILIPSSDDRAPPAHKRAAAFAISRMLSNDNAHATNLSFTSSILLPLLHDPFRKITADLPQGTFPAVTNNTASSELTPINAIITLTTIFTNTDPSPTLINILLTPIIPSLYMILEVFHNHRAADPTLKEYVNGLLKTWARISEESVVVDALWHIIQDEEKRIDWRIDIAGKLSLIEREESLPTISLSDLAKIPDDDTNVESNPFGLRPDPSYFFLFLNSLDREDVLSNLFVKLLESYRESSQDDDNDPMSALLYLQIILQMQSHLAESSSSLNIFKKPTHILTFINHALGSDSSQRRNKGLGKNALRIVEDEEDDEALHEGDSDDEDAPGLEGITRKDEMAATAINLLLSILEANSELSARTEPLLNDIFSQLEPFTSSPSDSLRRIAREARMVLTARLASTSASDTIAKNTAKAKDKVKLDAQETYQRALKLLQDPILPVRAHGLLLLRELVAPPASSKRQQGIAPQKSNLDPAFKPAVLSIFLESVQDEDSYIFMNAVQGLSSMVDGFGKDVLRGLIDVYTKGLDDVAAAALTQKDMDVRLRLAEALNQVIRRCGSALTVYVDVLVPPLFRILRSVQLPVIIRTSAISLLAQCVDTSALSVSSYITDLMNTMVDLLQMETVAAQPASRKDFSNTGMASSGEQSKTGYVPVSGEVTSRSSTSPHDSSKHPDGMSEQERISNIDQSQSPHQQLITSASTKLPAFRRAALHFLSLLVRAYTALVYDTGSPDDVAIITPIAKRTKMVLSYVAAVDEDNVVRAMARECTEGFNELQKAILSV